MISLFIAATAPVLLFLFFIYNKDTAKEPAKLLRKSFLWGVFIVIPAIIFETILDSFNFFSSPFMHSFYKSFFVAGLVEEGLKYWILYKLIWNNKEYDQHYDGIVYAVFVSLGFAFIENIFYVFEHGISTAILRAFLAVPGHGFFGVIMGYFFSLAKFSNENNRKSLLRLSLLLPIVFHGLYDFILFYIEKVEYENYFASLLYILFIVLIVLIWKRGFRYIKSHYVRDLRNYNSDKNDNFS